MLRLFHLRRNIRRRDGGGRHLCGGSKGAVRLLHIVHGVLFFFRCAQTHSNFGRVDIHKPRGGAVAQHLFRHGMPLAAGLVEPSFLSGKADGYEGAFQFFPCRQFHSAGTAAP